MLTSSDSDDELQFKEGKERWKRNLASDYHSSSNEDHFSEGYKEDISIVKVASRTHSKKSRMFEKVRLVNKMKIRMRRRKFSTRFFQICVVTVVVTLFLYFLFQAGTSQTPPPLPDFSWLKTRNMSDFLRPTEVTSLAAPEQCADKNVELLVFVTSAPANLASRRVIRKTWGHKLKKSANVKVFFALGRPKDSALHDQIIEESENLGDILYEDFDDNYLNLTLKTSFMLKWATRHCAQAKFIFKVDDDVYVNTEKLWLALESTHLYFKSLTIKDYEGVDRSISADYALIGSVMETIPIRDPLNKYYLPPKFYPLNIFPKFLSGTGYIFTGSLAEALYNCAIRTPFINLEDVFTTGLCATTQLGLRLTHNPGFQWRPMTVGGTHTCNFKQSVMVHDSFSPAALEEIFVRSEDDLLCDTLLFSFMVTASSVIDFLRKIFRI